MNDKRIFFRLPAVFFFFCMCLNAFSQSPYHLYDFDMRISGSSNLRDWETQATVLDLKLVFAESDNSDFAPNSIEELELRVPVAKIKSGIPGMDRNMFNALKARQHPEIVFKLDVSRDGNRDGNSEMRGTHFKMESTGTLSIAGVTRRTDLVVHGWKMDRGRVLLRGSRRLLMTDFDIDPPTALMGLVRTRNQIRVDFSLWLTKRSGLDD